ncbi:MAG: hypothetical protein ACI8TQ_000996 [Planctomycetota bacterium]|jgi:hypothetical protein
MRAYRRCLLVIALLCSTPFSAQDSSNAETAKLRSDVAEAAKPRRLESHEPNFIGFNKDKGSSGHLDFKVSLKYSFSDFPRPTAESLSANRDHRWMVYAGLTARLSQFIESQDSSPVIGRQFNPELFLRHWNKNAEDYVDFAFGHESNGQSINSKDEFDAKTESLIADGDEPADAEKFLSRGWDYLGVTWRKGLLSSSETSSGLDLAMIARARYFLHSGPLQGSSEDFFDFEGRKREERSEYDGLSLELRCDSDLLGGSKIALKYLTGYVHAFRNNTARVELTFKEIHIPWIKHSVPLTFWGQTGYNADLATYYQNSYSFGVGIELE